MKPSRIVIICVIANLLVFWVLLKGWSALAEIAIFVLGMFGKTVFSEFMRPSAHDLVEQIEGKNPTKFSHYFNGHPGHYEDCATCQTLDTV